jgi:UDP:flavonoid glycosyltransferase YjiC (YdhE family)
MTGCVLHQRRLPDARVAMKDQHSALGGPHVPQHPVEQAAFSVAINQFHRIPIVALDWLFPRLDVLVTNGGYGTVNQAISCGIPIVAAGLSEDKRDACARVAWSGVGIDLQTSNPEPEVQRAAVRKVVDEPRYRERAKALAAEFATYDTTSEIIAVLTDLAGAAPAAN